MRYRVDAGSFSNADSFVADYWLVVDTEALDRQLLPVDMVVDYCKNPEDAELITSKRNAQVRELQETTWN